MSTGKGRQMKGALRQYLAPALLARGFVGQFPVIRRVRASELDILELQFDKYGGGFRLNLGVCPSEGVTTSWGKKIAPEEMRFGYPMTRSYYLEPRHVTQNRSAGVWFCFNEQNIIEVAKSMLAHVELIDHWFLTGNAPQLQSTIRSPGGPIHRFFMRLLKP